MKEAEARDVDMVMHALSINNQGDEMLRYSTSVRKDVK